jgi:hypothetical protein
MDRAVGIQIDVAEVRLDLVEHRSFRVPQSFGNLGMNAKRCVTNVLDLF